MGSPSVPVAPTVLSKVYNSVALSKSLYGMDVLPTNESGLQIIEKAHKSNAKLIMNLPNNTPSVTPLALLGWLTIDSHVAMLKLLFLWRILCLPITNVYRRVLLNVLQPILNGEIYSDRSPTLSMYKYVLRYNMLNVLKESLNTDNTGKFPYFKRMIKKVVYDREYIKDSRV